MQTARAPFLIWLALLALLAVTAGSTMLDLGWGNLVVNLGVAAAKMVLILLVFMHLDRSSALVRLVCVAAGLWLALLFGLTLIDYGSR
jgi:cytochrome c oxidase subunit 4